jgi:hypothetical protein
MGLPFTLDVMTELSRPSHLRRNAFPGEAADKAGGDGS